MHNTEKTGYPSIERPWLKYYSDNATNTPVPQMTMYQYLWENNKSHLGENAFYYFGTSITFARFFEMINCSANQFWDIGIRKGDIVTIMSMHTPETLASFYALNCIGAVANMVYMTLTPKEILHTLQETESKALLILDAGLDRIRDIREEITTPVFTLEVAESMPVFKRLGYRLKMKKTGSSPQSFSASWTRKPVLRSDIKVLSDHCAPAVIVYTSGTTGEPKGVVLSSKSINAIVEQLLFTDRKYQRGDKALLSIPPFLGFGISMIHLCLSQGMLGDLFIVMDNDAVGKEFQRFKPKRFVTGPPCLDGIIRNVSGDLKYVEEITGGGSRINPEKENEFNSFLQKKGSKARYLTGYGMTESCSVILLNMIHAYKQGSLGIPLPYNNIRIEDLETREELPYGEDGEICISSPCLMLYYYRNQSATNDTIYIDDQGISWLRTGDVGYVDTDGFVFITGRLKRTFPTRGDDGAIYRIFTQRIEDLFASHQYVKTCGVIVMEDDERINIPIAYIVIRGTVNDKSVIDELKRQSKEDLPEHMRPQKILVLNEMPLTSSGKIDYQILEKEYEKANGEIEKRPL